MWLKKKGGGIYLHIIVYRRVINYIQTPNKTISYLYFKLCNSIALLIYYSVYKPIFEAQLKQKYKD